MKLSSKKRSVDLAENGVWITKAFYEIDLLIGAADNKNFTRRIRELMKPYTRNQTYKTMSDEVFEELQDKARSETVLLGWRNMESEDSTEENQKYLEYSPSEAYKALRDPENIEFRKQVLALAEEEEVFRKEAVEEATFQA